LAFLRDVLRESRPTMWKRFRPGIEALARHHHRRLAEQRRRFLRWWRQWQRLAPDTQLLSVLKH
jgi:hypothetical protein